MLLFVSNIIEREYVGIVWSMNRLKNAEWKIGDLESEWEDFLFRMGWNDEPGPEESRGGRAVACTSQRTSHSKRKPTVIFPTAIRS